MFRVPLTILASALLAVLSAASANASDARTTRIEPRPFYGATITLEAGVRVFRPLPRHKNIIINPGHRTPLNLTFKDVTERRFINGTYTYKGFPNGDAESSDTPAYIGGFGRNRRGSRRRHFRHRSHRRGGVGGRRR